MNYLISFLSLLVFIFFIVYVFYIFNFIKRYIEKKKNIYSYFSKKEFNNTRNQLIKNWNRYNRNNTIVPSDNDVYWALTNTKILTGRKKDIEMSMRIQDDILKKENKFIKRTPEYLNTVLKDGKTIKQHQDETLKKRMYLSSDQAKRDFPKEIDSQFDYIINNMEIRNDKYNNITEEEETILKLFLEKVSLVRKKYAINLIRFGNGMIRIEYNGCQVGQFNFRKKNYYLQALQGSKIREFDNISFNDSLSKVDIWVRYCKYQLKRI